MIPAATLIIFRAAPAPGALMPEILMVERASHMRFAAGASVFPGGRVDPADQALAQSHPGDPEDTAARIAAIRETLEETGLALGLHQAISAPQAAAARAMLLQCGALAPVLSHFGWTLDLPALTPFAHWRQPTVGGFDTRFYLVNLGSGAVDLAADATETTRLFWTTPANALRAGQEGRLRLIFPTRRNLERLARHASFEAAQHDAHSHPITPITPRIIAQDGIDWLTIPDGLGYPVLREALSQTQRE